MTLLIDAVALVLLACAATVVAGESSASTSTSTCLMVYQEGGAPAVLQSPKCPTMKLSGYDSPPRGSAGTRCQVAVLQGRRKYQEDRTFCALDFRIPFRGIREVTVGMIAVFYGHNGAEASDMASKHLFEYFMLHAYFLLDSAFSVALKKFMRKLGDKGDVDASLHSLNWRENFKRQELDRERIESSRTLDFDHSYLLENLKEALLRAIRDIDAKFSSSRSNLNSGSTATVILMADGKILVAHVGDSKALLCSEKFLSPADARANFLRLYRERRQNGVVVRNKEQFKSASLNGLMHLSVQELTRDHSPNRYDEKSRIEAAGGFVVNFGGVPRVNGQLAVSRSIGDVKFKSSGVIATPDVMDWQSLNTNDSYLVVASDGVFEELSPQDVCDILGEPWIPDKLRSDISCSHSVADCIVESAFKRGSMDNLAAVVVPLQSTHLSHYIQDRSYTAAACSEYINNDQSGKACLHSSDIIRLDHSHPDSTMFCRLDRSMEAFAAFI